MKASVLHTQEIMLGLERKKRELEKRLQDVQAKLEVAIENHRHQIARSLTSKDPEERRMAENVRAYYDVPLTD